MRKQLFGTALILFVSVTLVVYLWGPAEEMLTIVGNVAQTLAGLLSAVMLFRTASAFTRTDAAKPYWTWLSVGYLFNALGFVIYAWSELVLGLEVPTPSLADLFWVLTYPALLFGTFGMMRLYATSGLAVEINKLSWVAGAAVFLVAGYFLMLPIITSDAGWLEKVTLLAYPLFDAVLFAASISIALMMRQFGVGKLGAPWTFIALGMIAVAGADMIYTYLSAQGLYETGNLVDLGWVLQGALVAWGGALQYRLVKGEDVSGRVA